MTALNLQGPVLEIADFHRISSYVYHECGIKLGIEKKIMVESRLQQRLRALRLEAFNDYVRFVFDNGDNNPEIRNMIDRLTTNKTDFYREPEHFNYLTETVLPEFNQQQAGEQFRVWSAACSSGEEAYTIAMVIEEFKEIITRFSYSVLGTDLSVSMLEKARTAVYTEQKADSIPSALRKKYLLKSIDRNQKRIRIIPEIRQYVSFHQVNLVKDPFEKYGPFDAIFCRNVLIYFDRATQVKVVEALFQQIIPGGYLFVGHSEALTNFNLPLVQIRPSIYKKL